MERARKAWGPTGIAEVVICVPSGIGKGRRCTAQTHTKCGGGRPASYRVGTRDGVVFKALGVSHVSFEDAFERAGVKAATPTKPTP